MYSNVNNSRDTFQVVSSILVWFETNILSIIFVCFTSFYKTAQVKVLPFTNNDTCIIYYWKIPE